MSNVKSEVDAGGRGPFEPETERCWPLGPNYLQLFADGTKNYVSWSRFRLIAASWYLEALTSIFHQTNDLDRFVGVEMALDGFFTNASSAFDAAVGGLIEAIETCRGNAADERTPDHRKNWGRVITLIDQHPIVDVNCTAAVDAALFGDKDDEPSGWLAQLRRTRNRMTHHSTLTRHFARTVSEPENSPKFSQPSLMDVPGKGHVEPLSYMQGALAQVGELVEEVLSDANRLSP